MQTVNIHEAKTHLSKLIEMATQGDSFIIAKAGKPLVKVVSINAPDEENKKRLGFLQGDYNIPDDFDSMGDDVIPGLFGEDE